MHESAGQTWDIIERGAFVFAQCRECGWVSHGRRAYASAHKEGASHRAACPGLTAAVDDTPLQAEAQ